MSDMRDRTPIRAAFAGTFVCLAAAALAMSCSMVVTEVQTRNYYILNYTPATRLSASSQRPYKYSLQVGPFEVQRIFNRQNIVYRYSPHQIQYYELQQWAVRPDQMFSDIIVKHLETINLTNRIGVDFFDQRPDYRLEGVVEALEKFDAGDIYFAHLAMSFDLIRVADGSRVWDYSFDERRQVFQQEMVYTVRSLSNILQSQLDVVATQLDSLFFRLQTGKPLQPAIPSDISEPSEQPSVQVPGEGIDESAFEIIPEKR